MVAIEKALSISLAMEQLKKRSTKHMRKTIADIVSEASSVACWVYVQKYVKHKTLNEMLQELPDVGQFILAMDTWFEKLMEK
ncbi:hypothetical protein ACTQ50_19025 [Blautia sp. Sow4_E7]|uniref:hypothetical protein n=1 Tax=Blautia sp. Sow4_E7 TaxID=3438749 RepID=UPI003F8F4831